jgi:hypothetical protein
MVAIDIHAKVAAPALDAEAKLLETRAKTLRTEQDRVEAMQPKSADATDYGAVKAYVAAYAPYASGAGAETVEGIMKNLGSKQ